ncbi:response regulator [Candidatus Desulforudis audaxviator]|uniref:Transcriptional regulatory protein n=1 Tax=Desulforudis audaxviator (strain MP104C) TaxID=477974 RepID=B1I404_DESAP|nr:response regulator [Candidatus Desulforudis audaxviator]ACA59768.1 response regulator receiver [Candidatus Desulforudis audaxviator MP104C]AZK59767.1 response regulator receiver [Candidatus Desulforudis audaxviator]
MILKAVVLDSDPVMLEAHEDVLSLVPGCMVVLSTVSARSALEVLCGDETVLLLLELKLSGADGLELLREIRRQGLPVDVIVVTGAEDAGTLEQALRLGIFDYIIKPYRRHRLKSSVESYAAMYVTLCGKQAVNQAWVDDHVFRRFPNLPADKLPKGLHRLTMEQVVLFLGENIAGVSAEEVARGIGFSRATARRYLEYLARNGLARPDLEYGSIGRPTTKYRLV